MATSTYSLIGTAEQEVADPGVPNYVDDVPFGAGTWNVQIPTETQVFDTDNFSFEINDNGEAQNRLKDSLGAQFISFGERNVQVSFDRDFHSRDEYNEFKLLTEKSVSVKTEHDDGMVLMTVPVGYIETYDLGVGEVGGLVRASVTYHGIHDDETGAAVSINVTTDEDVPVPE
jgi:hypothetical protein